MPLLASLRWAHCQYNYYHGLRRGPVIVATLSASSENKVGVRVYLLHTVAATDFVCALFKSKALT